MILGFYICHNRKIYNWSRSSFSRQNQLFSPMSSVASQICMDGMRIIELVSISVVALEKLSSTNILHSTRKSHQDYSNLHSPGVGHPILLTLLSKHIFIGKYNSLQYFLKLQVERHSILLIPRFESFDVLQLLVNIN